MKFLHIADVHLGVNPDAGRRNQEKRASEIWESLERIIDLCEEEKIDLLLIAGVLFHRQPLLRELREVNSIFAALTVTQIVLSIGNHDYLKADSYYHSFSWAENVHIILDEQLQCVKLPQIHTSVYGCSYYSRERIDRPYENGMCQHTNDYEILMLHGGDEKHIPFDVNELVSFGYDYIALGHIHKHMDLIPGKAAYSGALEPTDKNDMGKHGYIYGEMTTKADGSKVCETVFVPFAKREYLPLEITVDAEMTGYRLKEAVKREIQKQGVENLFKIQLKGFRNRDTIFDVKSLDIFGNVIECIDSTKPLIDLEKLKKQNQNNIIGKFIGSLEGCDEDSLEYRALCEGIEALMETIR